jgi:hypothetical protein
MEVWPHRCLLQHQMWQVTLTATLSPPDRSSGRPQGQPDANGKRRIPCLCQESNQVHPAHRLVIAHWSISALVQNTSKCVTSSQGLNFRALSSQRLHMQPTTAFRQFSWSNRTPTGAYKRILSEDRATWNKASTSDSITCIETTPAATYRIQFLSDTF